MLCAGLLLVAPACSSRLATLERQVSLAQQEERQQAAQMRELHQRMESAREGVVRLIEQLSATEEAFLAAEAHYGQAALAAEDATETFEQARRDYEQAEMDYRRSAFVMVMAAGMDSLSSLLCDSTMSTQAYRKQLEREGIRLNGKDVDHIWPRAHQGAEHPWNYQLLPEELNRRLGASLWEKFKAWPLGTMRGLVVSALIALRCGS